MDVHELSNLFVYNQNTGDLFFKDTGRKVVSKDKYGYLRSRRFGVFLQAHRIAWALTYGYWPDQVDHINGVTSDNKIKNLREVNYSGNGKNRREDLRNKSGLTGVSVTKTGYQAQIKANGKYHYLYSGKDFFEACCRRKSAELEHEFHRNHGRVE